MKNTAAPFRVKVGDVVQIEGKGGEWFEVIDILDDGLLDLEAYGPEDPDFTPIDEITAVWDQGEGE